MSLLRPGERMRRAGCCTRRSVCIIPVIQRNVTASRADIPEHDHLTAACHLFVGSVSRKFTSTVRTSGLHHGSLPSPCAPLPYPKTPGKIHASSSRRRHKSSFIPARRRYTSASVRVTRRSAASGSARCIRLSCSPPSPHHRRKCSEWRSLGYGGLRRRSPENPVA